MIRKHAFACLLLISSLSTVVPAFAATAAGSANLASNSAIDTKLSALEVQIFSHSYSREPEVERVARLEKFVFSGTKADSAIADRVASLSSAVKIKDAGDAPYIPRRRPFEEWSAAANKPATNAPSTNYPRVSELEQRLFGQNYSGEPVAKRLDRLETRSFGKVSNSSDLAMRVDDLVAYVVPRPSLAPIRLASYEPAASSSGSNYHTNFFGLTRSPELASGVRGTQSYTVVDQIEYLENATFGKTKPNKTLQKRVDALEEKFYGEPKAESDKDISGRVAQLWHVVNSGNTRSNTILNRGA